MQKDAAPAAGKLDEFRLRDELRALRTQIPDSPALNPIVSLAFDLSRRLEAGDISFDRAKGARRAPHGPRLRAACAPPARARRLRRPRNDLQGICRLCRRRCRGGRLRNLQGALGAGPHRHRADGASDLRAVRRAVEAHRRDCRCRRCRSQHAHRRAAPARRQHRPRLRARARRRTPSKTCATPTSSCSTASSVPPPIASATKLTSCAPSWRRSPAGSATTSTGAPTSTGASRSSCACRRSVPRSPICASASSACKNDLPADGEAQRLSRQVTGKLDLTIAAVDEQIEALDKVMTAEYGAGRGRQHHHAVGRLQHHDGRADRQPVARADRRAARPARASAASPCWPGLMEATGLGTAHIHVRINAVQLNNAFRAFVHEPWTRDLSESQALARIVGMIETARRETVNFESLDLETATAIRQFALIAQIQKHVDRETPIRFLIAETEISGDGADRRLLRHAVRRRSHHRRVAAVRDAARPRDRRPRHRAPARGEGVRRLREAPAAPGAADRLLRRRPLRRPDRGDARHRASAPWPGRGDPQAPT